MSGAERRARRLLAAYPWRMRAERGDEIVGTVLDALPPGARRMPWRDQLDVVAGGVRTRLQRRPPLSLVMQYRIGRRLGPEWLGWVRDDVDDPHFRRSQLLRHGAVALALLVATALVPGQEVVDGWLIPLLILSGGVDVTRRRAAVRKRHGLPIPVARPAAERALGGRAWVANTRLVPVLVALGAVLVAAGVAALVAVGARGRSDRATVAFGHLVAVPQAVILGVGIGVILIVLLADVLTRPPADRVRADAVTPSSGRLATAVGVPAVLLVVAAALVPPALVDEVGTAALGALPFGVLTVAAGLAVRVGEQRTGHRYGIWDVAPRLGRRPRAASTLDRGPHPGE